MKFTSRSLFCQVVVACVALASHIALAQGDIDGCQFLPTNNIWNVPVDALPLDSSSTAYVNTIGAGVVAHADFGSGLWDGGPIGIPCVVVTSTQSLFTVS